MFSHIWHIFTHDEQYVGMLWARWSYSPITLLPIFSVTKDVVEHNSLFRGHISGHIHLSCNHCSIHVRHIKHVCQPCGGCDLLCFEDIFSFWLFFHSVWWIDCCLKASTVHMRLNPTEWTRLHIQFTRGGPYCTLHLGPEGTGHRNTPDTCPIV